jgi:hypothetical protein
MKIASAIVFASLMFMQAAVQNKDIPCQSGMTQQHCIETIGGFVFLKKYSINGLDKPNVEFSYVLTKGTSYLINLCSKDCYSNDMLVSIFDRQRNLVSTNSLDKKLTNSIRLQCNASGIYYMRYQSRKKGKFCGESILAFRREN